MPLATGTRLAAYDILAPIGAGGMGEVYRARDTRLGREVAVKVLSEQLLDDPDALSRFEREARAVAALSHPNIVALHDVGREQGVVFAVMELLDGDTLDRCIAAERLTATRAVEIAASIADGLASAHGKGIVHRDLKPANVFVTREGHVKILDFGLAKRNPLDRDAESAAPTLAAETEAGVFGTPGYMSPEQVKGLPVDHRTDIFALGCVLYEMVTRERAFQRDSSAETLAAILRDQPAFLDAARGIPPRIESVLRRCLEKNPDQRFQSARDLAFALRDILAESAARSPAREVATSTSLARRRLVWVAAGLMLLAATVLWLGTGVPSLLTGGPPQIRAIAVLPFANLSSDPEQDYFANAMTEELTTRLAKLGHWHVTSRTSAMEYRRSSKKIPEIAGELGVDALVQGSVVRDGSLVKITVQLIDGRTDRHLWADSYERELESVLAIQGDVTRAIASELDLTLSAEANAGLAAASRRVRPAAYEAYVRGRHAWEKRSEADLREAIRLFQQSIDADPTYAPAYAGLAESYGQLGYGSYDSPEDTFPRSRAAAERALALESALAEAYAALGYALMYFDWNFPRAEAAFKRAIDLNPNYAIAHQWYAYLLLALERPAGEAEREIAAAQRLDPLSVAINTDQAYMFHYSNRNEEARRSALRALEMNPKFSLGHFWLGRIYTSEGRYSEAEAELQNIGPLRTWTPAMAALGFLYGKSGRVDAAKALIGEFDALARSGRYASSYAVATIYAGLGDHEAVFRHLEAAYRERSHWLLWLNRDPRWDDFRTHARFVNLVRKVGLPSD